jgi:hypothetical protein
VRVVIVIMAFALVVSCMRLGDIDEQLQKIHHALEFQKR